MTLCKPAVTVRKNEYAMGFFDGLSLSKPCKPLSANKERRGEFMKMPDGRIGT